MTIIRHPQFLKFYQNNFRLASDFWRSQSFSSEGLTFFGFPSNIEDEYG
ncbi:MAG TPA: hypothetical protein PL164_00305 [Candidatus Paceibacterota bacterium]|nr:hypothetical protein [Candidatus Paceibacterota bacterium]HPP64794.1 hypothetical protein [Candidatus Paceibacterota bacterium]